MSSRVREADLRYRLGDEDYRLCWSEWGEASAKVVVCVHGLTRNGRDFDALAQALAPDFRVICPDLPGRGRSEWLRDPQLYTLASYVHALAALLEQVAAPVCWVGTSLGGLCGMALAASDGKRGAGISRLVLNDIGPFIPAAALARISAYLAAAPDSFPDIAALEAALRRVHAPFGVLTDQQWATMARHSARALPDGRVALHYDPAIAIQAQSSPPADLDLWPMWQAIHIPRLVVRGEASDLLLPQTYDRMIADGASGHVVDRAGHAPALLDHATMDVIRVFLVGRAR